MAEKEIKATPESYVTSTLSPIILSESQHVQISFAGRQVDNHADRKRNIKGKLIIKKKAKKELFSDDDKFSKKDITLHDVVEIELDTKETYELGKGLFQYYRLFSGKLTNPYDEVTYVEKDEQLERIKLLLQNDDSLLSVLSQIDTNTLNAAINIDNLKRIQQVMRQNLSNDQETAFWQPFFEKNAWILSQLFHAPVMFFKGKRYVGGKGLDDHGGQYTDFIYKNDITDNIALIEIKTPCTKLCGTKYRSTYRTLLYYNKHIDWIEPNEISKCIAKSEIIITDFSTLIFDFVYMRKPYICYIPDFDDPEIGELYKPEYFDFYENFKKGKSKFENVVYNVSELVDKIIYYINNDFTLENNIKQFYDSFNIKKGNNIDQMINYLVNLK